MARKKPKSFIVETPVNSDLFINIVLFPVVGIVIQLWKNFILYEELTKIKSVKVALLKLKIAVAQKFHHSWLLWDVPKS